MRAIPILTSNCGTLMGFDISPIITSWICFLEAVEMFGELIPLSCTNSFLESGHEFQSGGVVKMMEGLKPNIEDQRVAVEKKSIDLETELKAIENAKQNIAHLFEEQHLAVQHADIAAKDILQTLTHDLQDDIIYMELLDHAELPRKFEDQRLAVEHAELAAKSIFKTLSQQLTDGIRHIETDKQRLDNSLKRKFEDEFLAVGKAVIAAKGDFITRSQQLMDDIRHRKLEAIGDDVGPSTRKHARLLLRSVNRSAAKELSLKSKAKP